MALYYKAKAYRYRRLWVSWMFKWLFGWLIGIDDKQDVCSVCYEPFGNGYPLHVPFIGDIHYTKECYRAALRKILDE